MIRALVDHLMSPDPKEALEGAEELVDLSWEKLHTNHWESVPQVTQGTYHATCLAM